MSNEFLDPDNLQAHEQREVDESHESSVIPLPANTAECELQFKAAQLDLSKVINDGRIDVPLSRWITKRDFHFPMGLATRSLRKVLGNGFHTIEEARGVGETKLKRFVVLLERALHEILADAGHVPTSPMTIQAGNTAAFSENCSPELPFIDAKRRLAAVIPHPFT